MRSRSIVVSAALLLISAVAVGQAPKGFSTCELPGVRGTAWCGTISVPADRKAKTGPLIALSVVILPALTSNRKPDPVFWIEGGPGGSAIDDAGFWQSSPLRSSRDLVYIDLRGTGRSHQLKCDLFDRHVAGFQHFLVSERFPKEAVRKCAQELAAEGSLQVYTTPTQMDNVDDVRAALGYDQINIVGVSGGTHAALVYVQRHPAHVRTLVLNGFVAPYHIAASGFARYAQNALDGLARECASDHDCHQHFPDVTGDTQRVLAKLKAHDVNTEIPSPVTGDPIRVSLNRGVVAEIIRNMLYTPSDASDLPLLLHLAAEGDFAPIAEVALARRIGAAGGNGEGVYFSTVCAEDFPHLNVEKEEQAAQGTFLSTARVDQIAAACSMWPVKPEIYD